jgi:hypothetical protein
LNLQGKYAIMPINPPLMRILARYLAGVLVGWGFLQADIASDLARDPDILGLLAIGVDVLINTLPGLIIATVTEWFYWLAKKLNWRT